MNEPWDLITALRFLLFVAHDSITNVHLTDVSRRAPKIANIHSGPYI